METKVYLGDSVYAQYNDWEIILTTENGIKETNIIVLEPDVYMNLFGYIKQITDKWEERIKKR